MAVGANTIWWVQTTAPAGNTSGGGFDTGATFDNTLAATSATGNAPVVTSSNYTFVAGDVGYWIYIASGTNWTPGWYQIASVSGGAATLTATIGTALQRDLTRGTPYGKFQLNTVAGCATTASPTAGSWSIDYSKSDTNLINGVADLTIDATTNTLVTSASRTFGVNDIGNMIHISAGTSWTTGWFEITAVAAGAATLDRSPSAAANANKGTWYYGAASSLGSATAGRSDTNLAVACVGGNRYLIKAGTYTIGSTMAFTAGTANLPVIVEGYNTTPGDEPTGSSMPLIACGTLAFGNGTGNEFYNLSFTGTAASIVTTGTSGQLTNCKVLNTSSTAGRTAVSSGSSAGMERCDVCCYRGIAVTRGTGGGFVFGNYFHDSNIGFTDGGGAMMFVNNIFENCITSGLNNTTGNGLTYFIMGNTFYGAENKLGSGLIIRTTSINPGVANNLFYGLVTALTFPDAQTSGYSDYNLFFNNTTDISNFANWQYGAHDVLVNPSFTSVSQITGTAGAFTAANDRLVDTTKNFTSLGVVAGQDKIYIVSGTGSTAGIYGISSIATTTNPNDTLVLDLAPGTSTTTDKVYQITTGHNFVPTAAI